MRVLVLNPGSSSLKSSVIESADVQPGVPIEPIAKINVDCGPDASAASFSAALEIRHLLTRYEEAGIKTSSLSAIGYRVVHGGPRFREPALMTRQVVRALDAVRDLAPLHNGVAVASIRAGLAAAPQLPHVAVFDTAFHATLPEESFRYPVPEHWYSEWEIRRYGFHGLSVAWSVQRATAMLAAADKEGATGDGAPKTFSSRPPLTSPPKPPNVVVAHLGSGCSVTAVEAGRSVSTSMGLTPLEGLMMGTRSGSIDPGIVFGLIRDGRLSADQVAEQLDHESGLLGVSGRTSEVRELLEAEAQGDPAAALALAIFVRRAAEGIGAAATSLSHLDGIVFTGGIGENAGAIRERIVARLGTLGVAPIDDRAVAEDAILSEPGCRPAILRVEAREDLIVAVETARTVEAARTAEEAQAAEATGEG